MTRKYTPKDSAYLPHGMRDPLLRELLELLGLDFWALDDVQKEDLARAVFEHIEPYIDRRIEEQEEFARKENKGDQKKLVERFARAAKLEDPDGLASDDAVQKIADKVFDLDGAVSAWKDAYWDLRKRVYGALGLEDKNRDQEQSPEDARYTEAAVEEVAALRERERKDAREADRAETALRECLEASDTDVPSRKIGGVIL